MDDAIRKAEALIEACSYIRRFRDRLTVIKLGGSAMEGPAALAAALQDMVFMETAGMRPVLVHGGGKAIDRAMAAAGLEPRKVQGRRHTDAATLRLVVRTLLEENNADLVKQIRALGGRAVGLHSGPLQSLFGERLTLVGPEGPVDLGHVGQVTRVEGALIEDLCAGGVIPVIPSLAVHDGGDTGEAGGWLNVNADTAAAAIASEVKAEKLVFLTDTPGILRDRNDPASLAPSLDPEGCQELIRRGVIDAGMIPKVEACLDSLRAGVRKVHMIDGRLRHSLLLEIYTDRGVGTEITLARQ
jgi:acetylglutamate kinase